jgi:hypothetical protein
MSWEVFWAIIEAVIFVAALWAWSSPRALRVGLIAVAALFLAGGALFNTLTLLTGDYSSFADESYLPFVKNTWRSVVAPHQYVFIPLLIAFEAAVGVLVLTGPRRAQLGLALAIAFHVGLMFFGWVFWPFAIAMILAFALLIRAQRKYPAVAATTQSALKGHDERGTGVPTPRA